MIIVWGLRFIGEIDMAIFVEKSTMPYSPFFYLSLLFHQSNGAERHIVAQLDHQLLADLPNVVE
jgi:hypothetical protein